MTITESTLRPLVEKVVRSVPVTDIHTHLYAPDFGSLLLCGADELMSFHYIVSESFRVHHIPYEEFWKLEKSARAELIWKSLFEENSPLSEATSGVIEIAREMGCDGNAISLETLRSILSDVPTEDYISRILNLAGVKSVVMTNDPFDPSERAVWETGITPDCRFHAALRLDKLLNHFHQVCSKLRDWGYDVREDLNDRSIPELQRFLTDWIDRMNVVYVAFSAADDFQYPESSVRGRILEDVILPICRQRKLPLALMIGARRAVNPQLGDAGDSLGKASVRPIEVLCSTHPENKFLVTMLSRESQHELVVTARKFHNLMIFGCWWFVNTGSLVDEITRMRLELLGPTFIPQHSDARVLEHLIYKWNRARRLLANVLSDKYMELLQNGWRLTEEDIRRDVHRLLNDNFWEFVRR
jgi:hypothetical protein